MSALWCLRFQSSRTKSARYVSNPSKWVIKSESSFLWTNSSDQHSNENQPVICPICTVMPSGDPNQMIRDLARHMTNEHTNQESFWNSFSGTKQCIVGCVFPRVIVSILSHAEFGRIGHREDAPHFTLQYPAPENGAWMVNFVDGYKFEMYGLEHVRSVGCGTNSYVHECTHPILFSLGAKMYSNELFKFYHFGTILSNWK